LLTYYVEVELLVHLHKLPQSKLQEYDQFPLASQLGFIQAIPEADYNIASATITDVGFLGLFPIKIFQELRYYAKEIEHRTPAESTEFLRLFDQLICSFIYRPITIQKIIHFLISKHRSGIVKLAKRREAAASTPASTNDLTNTLSIVSTGNSLPESTECCPQQCKPCLATK